VVSGITPDYMKTVTAIPVRVNDVHATLQMPVPLTKISVSSGAFT